jgi:hypothetical protein
MLSNLVIFTTISLISFISSQSDGNPHNWDRQRRCDNNEYYPECGLCEGIGGIPFGDKNEEIKMTKCTPIANATDVDMNTVKKPLYPWTFTNKGFHEVMIGQKNDPFCFKSFPGPDSKGDHCYMPQEGTFHYDFPNRRLRIDYERQFTPFNISITTIHEKGDMWIINNLGAVTQCICINPGRLYNETVYPVDPYFLERDSRYIGREKIYVEYIWQERVADHWVRGPHHVWVDVETGYLMRMWQPFNGLEVYDPFKWDLAVDAKKFATPPKMCSNCGFRCGAWWRIGCNDDGTLINPAEKNQELSFLSDS